MKVVVTGATGFIGSRITHQLLALGHQVRILRRESSKLDLLGEAACHVEHAIGSITDPESVSDAVRETEVVFHAAAIVDLGARRVQRANVEGTANVVNASLEEGVKRLIHTSSIAALGRFADNSSPVDESVAWQPGKFNTPYAISKHEAELQIFRGIAEGLDAVIVNPTLVFGPGRRHQNTTLIAHYLKTGRLKVYPRGTINVVDVEDVAAGHIRAWQAGRTGERYILGSENLSWRTVLENLADALRVTRPRWPLPLGIATTAGAIMEIWAALSGQSPLFTRTLARSNAAQWPASNKKAVRELECRFRPFTETAQRVAALFNDHNAD